MNNHEETRGERRERRREKERKRMSQGKWAKLWAALLQRRAEEAEKKLEEETP